MRAGKLAEAAKLEPTKTELSRMYVADTARIKASQGYLDRATPGAGRRTAPAPRPVPRAAADQSDRARHRACGVGKHHARRLRGARPQGHAAGLWRVRPRRRAPPAGSHATVDVQSRAVASRLTCRVASELADTDVSCVLCDEFGSGSRGDDAAGRPTWTAASRSSPAPACSKFTPRDPRAGARSGRNRARRRQDRHRDRRRRRTEQRDRRHDHAPHDVVADPESREVINRENDVRTHAGRARASRPGAAAPARLPAGAQRIG